MYSGSVKVREINTHTHRDKDRDGQKSNDLRIRTGANHLDACVYVFVCIRALVDL